MMTQSNVQVEEKIKMVLKEPGKYAVVYMNDEQTPMDFVVDSLIKSPAGAGPLEGSPAQ